LHVKRTAPPVTLRVLVMKKYFSKDQNENITPKQGSSQKYRRRPSPQPTWLARPGFPPSRSHPSVSARRPPETETFDPRLPKFLKLPNPPTSPTLDPFPRPGARSLSAFYDPESIRLHTPEGALPRPLRYALPPSVSSMVC
jgi:hypothetical protein